VTNGRTAWVQAGFDRDNYLHPQQGNFVITIQSLVAGQPYPCNAVVTVSH
jgi:hypothetical protein